MADAPTDANGVLLVDKPPAWTSHDVVKFVRRFGFRKVGHCGTLDPSATGLLILVIGRATKLTNQLSGQDKVYEGTMELGTETFSQDSEGDVVATRDWSHVTPAMVQETCNDFVGPQEQIPPMVSAIKKDGRKLYDLARRGVVVERDPRPIVIHSLDVLTINLPDVAFQVRCSKGTYVRTLCADIGAALECGAFLKRLRRTASGRFDLTGAQTMDAIKTWNAETLVAHMIPLEKALAMV